MHNNTFERNHCKRQAPTNPSNGYTTYSLSNYENGPGTSQNMMLRCTRRNRCSGDCTTPSSIVQPYQHCTYRQISPLLQHNPVTKPSPTNLLSGFKFLLSRFIALCPTILVTLLERHHQMLDQAECKTTPTTKATEILQSQQLNNWIKTRTGTWTWTL